MRDLDPWCDRCDGGDKDADCICDPTRNTN